MMDQTEALARWLAKEALHDPVQELFSGFCQEVVRSGTPVWRASLGLEVLHPEVSGWQHIWTNESLSLHEADRATAATSQSYLVCE